ncbi:DNA-(apurinic or apyrimidinic site) lyase 2 [Colletotrichum sidae]|uniref:DNA-(apurinic or apyrimidinic site) endonuclease 2 n=1 Tax=Colletotrichum sidae TaxID=1347389 RepID=A0A4R8TQT5_9PEZI|nr:DNA-(apurinic or apyrimidinic site) lyase 2 [Colletotrichum sidae]
MGFRIVTWNVNGIRNPFGYQPWREQRTYQAMFELLEADIVIMQETKIQRKDLTDEMVLVPGWDVYFSLPKHKKGYSGVAIYTRNETCAPIRAEEGITGILTPPNSSTSFRDLPADQQIGGYPLASQLSSEVDEATLDSEGRCVILEFPAFVLIGTYSPATRDSSRDDFRLGYLAALDARVRKLVAAGKQVILTGDLNVVRSELDTCNLREQLRKEDFSFDDWMRMPARRVFNQLIYGGKVAGERDEGREKPVLHDLTRIFHPIRQGMFTCWDTKRNTRPANNGSRIDYVLCSSGIQPWFSDSNIQEGLMGSDHCPVYAMIEDVVTFNETQTPILDLVNPPDMFRDGTRLRPWAQKDLLPLSAKLIPEFDRRRNIRDMFMKKPTPKVAEEPPTQGTPDAPDNESSSLPSPQHPPSTQTPASTVSPFPAKRPPPSTAQNQTKRPLKRSKTDSSDPATSGSSQSRGQSTLTGFFKPKASVPKPPTSSPTAVVTQPQAQQAQARPAPATATAPAPAMAAAPVANNMPSEPCPSGGASAHPPQPTKSPPAKTSGKVFDPIEAKESWSKIMGKKALPLCDHGEPCISFQTKKPGINCGRTFYICARPLAQSGEKETGTEWRCGAFIWASDWKSQQSQSQS